MGELVEVNGVSFKSKIWNGQRVITFADVDLVHDKVEGTAKARFYKHKDRFVENEDYFVIKPADALKYTKDTLGIEKIPNRGLVLLTESGYLMTVKTYDDDIAWSVQRKLVNSYFKLQEIASESIEVQALQYDLSVMFVQVNNMENMLEEQSELLSSVMDNMTISTRQQEKILKATRDRVNHLLGGAHSAEYLLMGRTYLANLWNNFKSELHCGSSYKDLNPADFNKALDWIGEWQYI
jgi:hypothetical protein